MSFFDTQNPGIGGLDEITDAETLTLQSISALGDPGADRILFWDESANDWKFLTAGTGLTITGTTITASASVDGSGTTNEIAYWVDSDTLGALAVATYPSLAELAHVKGVTSAIQTQFTGKAAAALSNLASVAINTSLISDTDNTDALGVSGTAWSDLFLGDGAVINFNAGDVTITHSANTLTVAGGVFAVPDDAYGAGWNGSLEVPTKNAVYDKIETVVAGAGATTALDNLASVAINTTLVSDTDNTDALGTTAIAWSDLFLGSGGVITFNSAPSTADITITHSADTLTFAGGTIVLGTATAAGGLTGNVTGNVSGTAATVTGATQAAITTLANLTSVQGLTVTLADAGADAILGWDDSASAYENLTQAEVLAVIGDSSATAKGVVELATDAETVTGTDTVRATTPANITAKMAAPGTIGGTTPAAATFTTLTVNTSLVFAENVSLALDSALSADGKYTGITRAGTAGATLAFGDLVYLAAADSRWELADADAASTSGDVILGMCVLAAAADADPTTILLFGNIRADTAFPALTIGAPAYVGTTAGDIQTAQPSGTDDVIRRVGFALTADELLFNPSNDYVTHT